MIILEQFTPNTKKRLDFSPFCAKVEAFLRYHKIDYQVKAVNVRSTPKNKLPVLVDGDLRFGDSDLILKYLSKKFNIDMNGHLDPREKASSLAMRKLFEDWIYWGVIYFRWKDDQYWPATHQLFFNRTPWIVRTILAPWVIRPTIVKQVVGQGMGRHTPEEVIAMMEEAAEAVHNFLGDRPYFMGDKISLLDMTAFPFIWLSYNTPLQNPIQAAVGRYDNLQDYADRLFKEIWQAEA